MALQVVWPTTEMSESGEFMVTQRDRDRDLDRERTIGELLEAAKQGSRDRDDIKRKLEQQDVKVDEILANLDSKLKEQDQRHNEIMQKIAEQHAEYLMMEDDIRGVTNLAGRMQIIESRVSAISVDVQMLSSLAAIVRRYSLRILLISLIAVIAGLSAGLVGVGKFINFILQWVIK